MSPPDPETYGEVNLRRLVTVFWRHRWLTAGLALIGGTIAAAYAMTLPNVYRAEVLLQVRQDQNFANGFGGVRSPLEELAGMAGLAPSTGADRARILATLRSKPVVQGFIADKQLLPVLFKNLWDQETKRWQSADPEKQPTLWHGHRFFTEKVLAISEDKKTWLVTLAIEWDDPVVAAEWATDLVARANRYLRDQAISEGEKRLESLHMQLGQTGQIELQTTAYRVVELELKRLMLARGTDEFALRTVDPAQAPKQRSGPRRRNIALLGALGGAALGFLVAFGRYLANPLANPKD